MSTINFDFRQFIHIHWFSSIYSCIRVLDDFFSFMCSNKKELLIIFPGTFSFLPSPRLLFFSFSFFFFPWKRNRSVADFSGHSLPLDWGSAAGSVPTLGKDLTRFGRARKVEKKLFRWSRWNVACYGLDQAYVPRFIHPQMSHTLGNGEIWSILAVDIKCSACASFVYVPLYLCTVVCVYVCIYISVYLYMCLSAYLWWCFSIHWCRRLSVRAMLCCAVLKGGEEAYERAGRWCSALEVYAPRASRTGLWAGFVCSRARNE